AFDGRIKAIAHRQRVAEEELRLVGQEVAQGRHRPDRLVLALEPKLAGAPVNQPVECEIPAETQRLSRQLRCHAEIVTHRSLHIAAADRWEKIRALLPYAEDDKEVSSRRTWDLPWGLAAGGLAAGGLAVGLACRIRPSPHQLWNAIMPAPSSDGAFTPSVKAVQEKRGSRAHFAKMEATGGWRTAITSDLAAFLAEARSFYLASASADGQPYVQHRGGPPGFLRVLDEHTLGFADFNGNGQYITTGNLAENGKAFIFVMDSSCRRHVKLWGHARVLVADDGRLARLWPEGYQARVEQVILFAVTAWDSNCPQHIPQMFRAEDVRHTLQQLQARIRELEGQVAALKGGGRSSALSGCFDRSGGCRNVFALIPLFASAPTASS